MNRMFFHLLLLLSFTILTSCTSDDERMGADEMEGPTAQMDSEESSVSDDDFGDLEDVQIDETASSTESSSEKSKDSFSDIESFNEGLIGDELAKEDIAQPDNNKSAADESAPVVASGSDELDLESTDFQSPSETIVDNSEPLPEVTPMPKESLDNRVTNLEYKSSDQGGTVIITAEKPIQFQIKEESEFNQVIIEVADVKLPDRLKRPYIAKDFGQPVATINAYQDPGATTARFVIQYKNATKPSVELKNNMLLVSSQGEGISVAGKKSESDDEEDDEATASTKLVTIQMDNVEIKEVINFIAEESGVNILADDKGLNGKITVRLRDVPWEDALMSILKSHGLGYVKKGNILRIAPQKLLADEAENYLKQVNSQQNAVRTLRGKAIRFFPINYADVEDLSKKIKPFLSPNAKVSADKKSNSLVISEFVNQMGRVEKILKSLDVQPLQIMIEGKIIEASEEFRKDIGVNWNMSTPFTQGSQSGTITNSLVGDQVGRGLTSSVSAGVYDLIGDLTATLQIFETENKIKILSSPRIVTLNREKAVIKQTKQFPILNITPSGNGGLPLQSTTFKDVELLLEVTPQVTFNGDTLMDVKVVRDIPGPLENNARQINKREATTKVIVKDGQTMVIGGIYSMDESNRESGIPWLKDIPVLGYLFKSKTRESNKNELLIFLTPRIVNPEAMRQAVTITQDTKSQEETLDPADFENEGEATPGTEQL